MKKHISYSTRGHRADIGPYIIYRMVVNRYADAVGPFVFLDHVVPVTHSPGEPLKKVDGTGAHPHRGIATLTYILHGEADHHDSRGNRALVHSGGAQWMKAGNGIIHDEVVNVDSQTNDHLTHAFQFWVNLPAKNKTEDPQYLPIQAHEIPRLELGDGRGWIKIIAGEYERLSSRIPAYLTQFIYHIHLESGARFSLGSEKSLEYGALLAVGDSIINDRGFEGGELVGFGQDEGEIEIINTSDSSADIIVFGGEPYTEPIVAQGPFVMNTEHEISEAYNDYYKGKYGRIESYDTEPVSE